MQFDEKRPIYLQVKEIICWLIAAGELLPGQKVPSIRELALRYKVNPNTIQRALRELEGEGVVFTRRGQGNFVTEEGSGIGELRRQMVDERGRIFVSTARSLGFGKDDILKIILEITDREMGEEEEI